MRFRTWPVAALGLGSLLVLIVVSVLASSRQAETIYDGLNEITIYHHDVDGKLRRLRSNVHLSGIFLRDYLLDVATENAADYRQRLEQFRRTSRATISELRAIAERHDEGIRRLEAQLDEYWRRFDPVFDWTPSEKASLSAEFLQSEVVPRREKVMTIAYEIEALNEANLTAERAKLAQQHEAFRAGARGLLLQSVLLGLVVALVSVFRLRSLERRSEEQRKVTEEAERQMRLLSQRLVATQEEERRKLSRELHDHVAQVLTALRMEIGRIDRARAPSDTRLGASVVECRQLVDRMFHTVRELALGLRPSMLDDLGLEPALGWQVRDFVNRYNVGVDLRLEGDLDALPDRLRTCIYRIVQEALTNCIRHANARSVVVAVTRAEDHLDASVSDDGVGFRPDAPREGLGLRGIEERVKELGGALSIRSASGQGTVLAVRLPLTAAVMEVALARAAG
jgi:signal transduction histidine kinase